MHFRTLNRNYSIAVICSFFAGSIISGTTIFADPGDKGNPFERIQHQIDDIINGNTPIQGESKILFLGNGFGGPNQGNWYGCVGASQDTPLSSCTRNVPLDGKITNLTASSMRLGVIVSPGIGESYKVTLVKNGIDTNLSCMIADNDSVCQNTSVSIQVFAGDRIDLKITSSENPHSANIAGSAVLRP